MPAALCLVARLLICHPPTARGSSVLQAEDLIMPANALANFQRHLAPP